MTTASGMSTVKSKNTTKAGLAVETMSAPNPFCPNTKGVCCLMVLTNLSLILICIGFIIVLQLTDPPVVWSVNNYIELLNFGTSDTIGWLSLSKIETHIHKLSQLAAGFKMVNVKIEELCQHNILSNSSIYSRS